MESERRSQRYPSLRPVHLRCESWSEFVSSYARDVGRGGMYIHTDDPPEVLSAVEVQLELPGGTLISLCARVVHVIGPKQAAEQQRSAGIGVEFMHLDAEQKHQIQQLVAFAERQQAGADPDASFNRTLLETTPSLPPRAVAERLSHISDPSLPAQNPRPSASSAAVQAMRPARPDSQALGAPSSPRVPVVRGPSVPLTPPNRQQSMPLSAAGRTPGAPMTPPRRQASMPLTPPSRQPSVPLNQPTRSASSPQARPSRAPSAPLATSSARPSSSGSLPAAGAQPGEVPAAGPPRPTDVKRLTLVLNSLAHKHYEDASRLAREMLVDNPGDPQVLKWQFVCFARMAAARGDAEAAAENYLKSLQYDENNREARDYVRGFQRDRKLNSIPFGRYFVKKK